MNRKIPNATKVPSVYVASETPKPGAEEPEVDQRVGQFLLPAHECEADRHSRRDTQRR
jgi:hypothetical protein